MNSHGCQRGLILSSRIIVAHQTATLLEKHGWQAAVEHNTGEAMQRFELLRPRLLVIDIDLPAASGLHLLASFRRQRPDTTLTALCSGGNSQSMRIARELGVDGYFYLQPHGMALDSMRGIARHGLPSRQG